MYDIWQILIKYIVIQNMKHESLIVNLTQQAVRLAGWALRRFSPRPLQSRRSSASRFSTKRYFCFVFTTLRLYMDTIHSFYQKIFYSTENGVKVFFNGTMMYADRDGFLDLQNQIISRWTSLWWTTVPTWSASSGWTALGSAPLTSPWRRWAGENNGARIS